MFWQSSRISGMQQGRFPWLSVLLLALAMLTGSLAGPVRGEEPCNPIIDGTYCATQMPKNRGYSGSSDRLKPIEDISRLVPSASVGGSAGTPIGISVQGNRSCFGLLRRSVCD
jgi:hypothetical protein